MNVRDDTVYLRSQAVVLDHVADARHRHGKNDGDQTQGDEDFRERESTTVFIMHRDFCPFGKGPGGLDGAGYLIDITRELLKSVMRRVCLAYLNTVHVCYCTDES